MKGDKIQELLDQDDIKAALNEIFLDMENWEDFGSIVIAYVSKDIIKHRFFGSNSEVIGLLEIGKQLHMDRILYNEEEAGDD
jgi:hypothetical protein